MQHADGERKGNYSLQFHFYPISEDVDPEDAVLFAYGDYMQCEGPNKREIILGDVDLFYLSDEKEALTVTSIEIRLLQILQ